ncbi:NUDIX hydrolase [Streptomyces sp. B21-108]|uniref:NUDIX hydrolase n=1 Tax=Streptomyces sp. B21-108 TaxID=3039419 RepID=UPI002FEF33E4
MFDNDDAAIEILDTGPVGLVYADPYIQVVRDPVRFPDGRTGGYVRVIHTTASPPTVILPHKEGSILLLEIYRHALRSWALEAPRGFGTDGLSGPQNAARELAEELQATAREITFLGSVYPDSGLMSQQVEVYLAELTEVGTVQHAEGIRRAVWLTTAEVSDRMREGTLTDGFTLSAIALARAHNAV